MREIKFRAYDLKNKQWHHSDECCLANFFGIILDHENDDTFGDVQQYTGLKDKNGKEIYEGDIVKHKIAAPEKSIKRQIIFDNFCWNAVGKYRGETDHEFLNCISGEEMEVIGNIYEHKDLLK